VLIVAVVAEMAMGGYGPRRRHEHVFGFADSRGSFAGIVEIAAVVTLPDKLMSPHTPAAAAVSASEA